MPALLLLPVLGVAAAVVFAAFGKTSHPSPPAPPPDGALQIELDHDMPETLVHQVLAALVHGRDASQLEALARECEGKYPLAATALRSRAAALRAAAPALEHHDAPIATPAAAPVAQAPSLPTAPSQASPQAAPPIAPAITTPPLAGPSADAARVVAAAMRAMAEEKDPVVLEGFADSVRAHYPDAATLLAKRAADLRASAPSALPPPASAASSPYAPAGPSSPAAGAPKPPSAAPPGLPPPGLPSPALPGLPVGVIPPYAPPATQTAIPLPAASAPAAATTPYVVKPGDSEYKITQAHVHDVRRWHELVDANPTKPRKPDGHFVMLRAGETIALPASWTTPARPPLALPAPSKGAHP